METKLLIEFTIIPREGTQSTPLLLYVSVDGRRKCINTGIPVWFDSWNRKTGTVKRGRKGEFINGYIHATTGRILSYYYDYLDGRYSGSAFFKNVFQIRNQSLPLLSVLRLYNRNLKSAAMQKNVAYLTSKLKCFAVHKQVKDFMLISIDKAWATEFHIFLMKESLISAGTVRTIFNHLRTVLNFAVTEQLIPENILTGFEIRRVNKLRDYLSLDELRAISAKKIHDMVLKHTKLIFLLQCYTGLTYRELSKLTIRNFVSDDEGMRWLKIKRRSVVSMIPFMRQSARILKKLQFAKVPYTSKQSNSLVPVFRLNQYNLYLKKLFASLAIDKKLTSNSTRETFVKTVLLSNGVSIESVSNMVGHHSTFYTKVMYDYGDLQVSREMIKPFKFFNNAI